MKLLMMISVSHIQVMSVIYGIPAFLYYILGNLGSLKLLFIFLVLIFNFEFIPVDQMLVNPAQKLTETILGLSFTLYILF